MPIQDQQVKAEFILKYTSALKLILHSREWISIWSPQQFLLLWLLNQHTNRVLCFLTYETWGIWEQASASKDYRLLYFTRELSSLQEGYARYLHLDIIYIKCIFKRYISNLSKAVHHLRISLATIIVSILLCFSCMFVVRRRFQETLPLTNLRNLNLYQQIRTNNALITLTVHNFVKIVTTVYLTSNDVKSQIAETSTIFQQLVQPSNNENMNTLHDSPFFKNNPPMIGELPSQNARMREEFPGHDVNIALC